MIFRDAELRRLRYPIEPRFHGLNLAAFLSHYPGGGVALLSINQ